MALFDIRPINPQSGRVNFDFINNLKSVVNLNLNREITISPRETSYYNILLPNRVLPDFEGKEASLQELQATLADNIDFTKELKLFGGRLVNSTTRLRPKPPLYPMPEKDGKPEENGNLDKFREEFSKIFSVSTVETAKGDGKVKLLSPPSYLPWAPEISKKESQAVIDLSPAGKELDMVLTSFLGAKPNNQSKTVDVSYKAVEEKASKFLTYFALSIVAAFAFTFLSVKSLNLKNNILQRSNQAYINLNSVQDNLSEFKFFEAASSFALAAKNFELMHEDLKKVSSVFNILDKVFLGSVSNASDLIKAGELISQAGLDLAGALEMISGVNLISVIQPQSQNNILEVLRQFRLNLIQASRNLNQAGSLISGSDTSLISESEKKKFDEFRVKLPEFNGFIEKAIGYSDALMKIFGQSGPQRYILLFQNSSELRPTGGFPGSYALVEFDKGVMKKFMVDDIYNPDGQMKEKIIPPRPLQRITPNWGMRDANWFVDFRTSAKKVAEFYYKDTGILVDGVTAVNVDLVPEILKITGPIEMPEFEITLNSENFIPEVQREVEYERTKGDGQPKEILVEFGPKLLERLSGLGKEGWVNLFALLVSGVEKKDILAYFADSRLQDFAASNGFAGEIKEADSDFLMITHSNIMGSKTDAVIDNFVFLNIETPLSGETDSSDGLIHDLEIKRKHKGGEFGFYNKKNNDYLRILVPEDAELVSINGNDVFETSPLLNYRSQGFVSDPDLERYESRVKRISGEGSNKVGIASGDAEIFYEGEKKIIAFWMIIEPGQTKTVKIKYRTSAQKRIYVQKQPGLKSDFKLIFNDETLFDEGLFSDKNIGLE